MKPWNPYAMTFHGQPIVGQTPPKLVVYGPPLTAQQGAMLQTAYNAFVGAARVSIVPNPTRQGRLPDGSPYTIECSQGVCTCTVWPVEDDDLPRRSGIGLSLTTLNGGLVPGHIHKDGLTPQPYILTPEVFRGTKKCTGKWRIRKVDGYSGGKAVWGDEAGARFVTGVNGAVYDIDLMDYRSLERIFGTNNRAYWAGEYTGGTHIYRNGEKILGSFRERIDTLPFFRRRLNKDLWAMQITPVLTPEQKLQLWGEKFEGGESTASIGELLYELEIPSGYSMMWQTISVSPDGNNIRMTMRRTGLGLFSNADIEISDSALSIVSIVDLGSATPGRIEVTTTGSQIGNGTFTRTEVITPGWMNLSGGYGYDAQGGKTDFRIRSVSPGERIDRTSNVVEVTSSSGDWSEGYSSLTFAESRTTQESFPYMSVDYGGRSVHFEAGGESTTFSRTTVDERWRDDNVPGGVRRHTRTTGKSVTSREDRFPIILFADHLTDLFITAHSVHSSVVTAVTDITYNFPPGGSAGTVDNSTTTVTHQYSRRLVAKCKGQEVLRVDTPLSGPEHYTSVQYVACSAIDPLTGAVCVNVLELDTLAGAFAPPLRSWIILADDTGAKMLHEVMDVPESDAIRVKKDYALLSVV